MKKMAYIAIAAALVAAAAADGAFVGLSLGRSQASVKIKNDGTELGASGQLVETNTTNRVPLPGFGDNIYQEEINTTQSAIANLTRKFLQSSDTHDTKADFAYGILAGYRWFLGDTFAIRGYGELDYQPTKLKGNIPGSNKLNALMLTAGADALAYFNRGDGVQFAAFAGVGVAYHRYDLKLDFLDKSDFDSFGFMANLGLHADVTENHGIELGARFFTNEAKGDSTIFQNTNNSASFSKYDIEIKQKPTFFLRYIYQF